MGTGGKVRSWLNVPALRRLEAACMVLAAVAAAAQLGGLLSLIGGAVVPFWAASGALAAVSVVLRIVSRRVTHGLVVPPLAASARLLRSVVTFGVALVCLGAAVIDLSASYRVLDPAGAHGCRAVVREYSFLFAGSGSVYAVGFGGIGTRVSSWTTDDGYEPVAHGSYTLRWDGGTGTLNLIGGIDPVWPAIHTIGCTDYFRRLAR